MRELDAKSLPFPCLREISTASPPKMTSSLLYRLSLPKFLLKEAHRVMQRPGPYSLGLATSILHDAAEGFLRILAVELQLKVHPNQSFSEVLGTVSKEISSVARYRAALTQLNAARVMFKHQGLSTVQKNDVIVFAGNVESFLTEACRAELNLDFSTVSLAEAIGHRRTQNWIGMAEEAFERGDHETALERAAGAMCIYRSHSDAHDPAFRDAWSLSAFAESDLESASMQTHFENRGVDHAWRRAVGDFARWAKARIDSTDDRVRLMARGVDVGAYDKFMMMAPIALMTVDGSVHFQRRQSSAPASGEDVRFCIDLVIDSALALRSNRPPAPSRGTGETVMATVVEQADVLVNPDAKSPEVIRTALPGELLRCFPGRNRYGNTQHLAVIQDGDIAYVARPCVEVVPAEDKAESNVS